MNNFCNFIEDGFTKIVYIGSTPDVVLLQYSEDRKYSAGCLVSFGDITTAFRSKKNNIVRFESSNLENKEKVKVEIDLNQNTILVKDLMEKKFKLNPTNINVDSLVNFITNMRANYINHMKFCNGVKSKTDRDHMKQWDKENDRLSKLSRNLLD